jgi:hypothetical protein
LATHFSVFQAWPVRQVSSSGIESPAAEECHGLCCWTTRSYTSCLMRGGIRESPKHVTGFRFYEIEAGQTIHRVSVLGPGCTSNRCRHLKASSKEVTEIECLLTFLVSRASSS